MLTLEQVLIAAAQYYNPEARDQQEFPTPGTYSFTVPTGVTSICAVAIGGGGGGAGGTTGAVNYAGATGGSGVVIIRSNLPASSTTGSPVVTTVSGNTVYKFNNTGSITF